MKNYLPQIACGLSLLVGLSIGWYFGYTRPDIRGHRLDEEILKESGLPKKEAARAVAETLAANKREDESTALMSLGAIGMLDRGAVEKTKSYLAYWVGSYYQAYRTTGDTNLLAKIQAAASTNTQLAIALTNLAMARAAIKEAAIK